MSVTYDYIPHSLKYASGLCTNCNVSITIGSNTYSAPCTFTLTDQQYSGTSNQVTAGYQINGTITINTGGTATQLYYELNNGTSTCISATYPINVNIPNYTQLTVNIAVTYTSTTT